MEAGPVDSALSAAQETTQAGGSAAKPSRKAFYVATDGSDSNPGTLAKPFATLDKAQKAMRASKTIKTVYIRAGIYALPTASTNCDGSEGSTCGLNLTAADSGETWGYYPPDGVDSADLTGGSSGPGTGLVYGIYTGDNENVTIDGLSIHDFQYAGIGSTGGVSKLTVTDNLIFNGTYAAGSLSNAAGIMCYGCASTTLSHNVVHDIPNFGISISNVNGDISNLLVTGNVVYDVCTGSSDCGALYAQDVSGAATNLRLTNNFVRDIGRGGGGRAIYLDDGTSNVTVSGNIIAGNKVACFDIHGGSNDSFTGNICDEAASGHQGITVYQQSSDAGRFPMTGNLYQHNIIISGSSGGGLGYAVYADGSAPRLATIKDNDYYNYAGGALDSTGTGGGGGESSPADDDPQLCGWTYTIASGSPVFNSPVAFPPIAGAWGPPGYEIPQVGTPPSSGGSNCADGHRRRPRKRRKGR